MARRRRRQQEVEEPQPRKPISVWKVRIAALFILIAGAGLGYFIASTEQQESRFSFKYGLDLAGGTHLVYGADTSQVPPGEVDEAMRALREVIERRVNVFGVSEPLVQVEQSSFVSETQEERLIVELPGVTDVEEAIRIIGQTPELEFKLVKPGFENNVLLDDGTPNPEAFEDIGLTGRFLQDAQLQFGSGGHAGGISNEPIVLVNFNSEGGDLFAEITREHVGEQLAIFLDGQLISQPVIREEIPGGTATISGNFDPDEARELVRNLNLGALPVPIELRSTQTIGATLGAETLTAGVSAGFVGLALVALFMLLWYRLPGVVAVVSLAIYGAVMLTLFKLIPVTLTAAGLAGFILSIGLAVDANVIIFERLKEELREGKDTQEVIRDAFLRAWASIRDGNISSIIIAVILFWLGTALLKGFAVTFGIGVLVSMLTAITITRTFLLALGRFEQSGKVKALFGSGIRL